jgi:polar amino acid transport system ATP-binding protein
MTLLRAPLLEARDIHKSFGKTEVLKGIDLTVAQGSVVALIGASGSGKTTFLRCINVLEEFDQGQIFLDDEPVGYVVRGDIRRRLDERTVSAQRARIAMVFQQYNLFPHLTAQQNVMLGLTKVRGMPAAEAAERAVHWLDRVGLSERRGHYPYQLSGGQQQRVAIARAVAMEPRLVLFDEVTSALDPELVGEVLVVMRDLARQGMTMMVVTHEIAFAREVADRVVVLDHGRIIEAGPARKVLDAPANPRAEKFLRRVLRPLEAATLENP